MSSLAITLHDSFCYIPHGRKAQETATQCVSSKPERVVCPELAGLLVRKREITPIYIIDPNGYRRLVPFPSTFVNLFKDSALDENVLDAEMVTEIAEGPPLDEGAILVRGISAESIYLLDQGRKRQITTCEVMNKYGFNEKYVVVIPQILLDAVPTGEIWE